MPSNRSAALWAAGAFLSLSLAANAARADDLPVLAMTGQSGPTAYTGVPMLNGVRLAFEEANASGAFGSNKVVLVERDTAGDKAQAINISNQAIDRDKIVLAIGPNTSDQSVAVAPIFNERETPNMSLATAQAILATGPWTFKLQQSPTDVAPVLAKYVLDKTDIRKIAIVYDRANEGMVDYMKFFRDPFKAGGGEVVTEEAVVSADTNFLPLATKLKSLEIDAIYFSTYDQQTANMIQQLRQAGLSDKVRFIGTLALVSKNFIKGVGSAGEGTLAVGDYIRGLDRPLNKAFEAAYKAKYGADPDNWAAIGYSSAQLVIAAIKAAGDKPTRETIHEQMLNLKDVPTLTGSGVWNHTDRRPRSGALVLELKGDQFVQAPQ